MYAATNGGFYSLSFINLQNIEISITLLSYLSRNFYIYNLIFISAERSEAGGGY